MDLSPPLGPTPAQPQALWSPPSSHRSEGKTGTPSSLTLLPPVTLDGHGNHAWGKSQKMATHLDTPGSTTAHRARQGLAGRPGVPRSSFFSLTALSAAQPISLPRRQERELCLKMTSKQQSAVFKENHRPHAPGGAESISGGPRSVSHKGSGTEEEGEDCSSQDS